MTTTRRRRTRNKKKKVVVEEEINPFMTNGTFHKFDTVKSGWSIVYIEGLHVITFKNIKFFLDFVLTNNADPDEMPPYAAFHLGLHCLP